MGNCCCCLKILTAEKLDAPSGPENEQYDDVPRSDEDTPNILDQTSPVEDTPPSDVGSGKPANHASIFDEDNLNTPHATDKKPPVEDAQPSDLESEQPAQDALTPDENNLHTPDTTDQTPANLNKAIEDNAPVPSGISAHDEETSIEIVSRSIKTELMVPDMVQSANDDSSDPFLRQSANRKSRSGEGIVNTLFDQPSRHERTTVVTSSLAQVDVAGPVEVITVHQPANDTPVKSTENGQPEEQFGIRMRDDPTNPMFKRRVRKDVSSPNFWQTTKMIVGGIAGSSSIAARE